MSRLADYIYRIPKGSIWQTRYVCFPLAIVASTLFLSRSDLSGLARAFWFFSGVALWTLLEYVLHRWMLHYSARSLIGRAVVDRLHVLHHHDPKDQTQVCIPPWAFLTFLSGFLALAFATGIGWERAALLTSGVGLMMALYDITHFSTHYMPATNAWLRLLKKQHMLHHFSDHTKRFGVTSPLWDYVFRTHA